MDALRPPQEDIDSALEIEKNVKPENWMLYLGCLNGIPMSERKSNLDIRDGCILTHHVYLTCLKGQEK